MWMYRKDLLTKWQKWWQGLLSSEKTSWTFYTPYSVCRPHRSQISRLSDSKSCEREGNNSLVDVKCEKEWWCYSMFHDSVPRERTGLDQWKCLVGGGRDTDDALSAGLIWENDDVLAPWSMALSPAGESGTIDEFWHPGSCSNFELCAMAKQLSVLQTTSLLWAHPSLSSRPSSISQRWMRKSARLYMFSVLPSFFCPYQVWFMCSVASPLNYGAEGPWHHPPLEWYIERGQDLLKGLGRWGVSAAIKEWQSVPWLVQE